MAQKIDSSSARSKSPRSPSDIHAVTEATMLSPSVAPDDDQTVDRCVQDIDPSHASTVSHIGDCNLECCHCAIRWSARRNLLQGEAEI
jgi:hypothetical protein